MNGTFNGTIKVPFLELQLTANIFVFLLCFTSNLLVVYTLIKERLIRKPFEYILVHLAISDIGVALFNTLFNLMLLLNDYKWALGLVMCKLLGAMYLYFFCLGTIDIVLISCIRFKSVVYPFKQKVSLKSVKKFITTSNVVLLCSYYVFLAVNLQLIDEVCYVNPRSVVIHTCLELILLNILPTIILVFTNCSMAIVLCRRSRQTGLNSTSQNVRRKVNIKAFRISLTVMICYLLASSPLLIGRVILISDIDTIVQDSALHRAWLKDFFTWITIVSMLLSNCSGAFIYGIFNATIRRGYRKALSNILRR